MNIDSWTMEMDFVLKHPVLIFILEKTHNYGDVKNVGK